MIVTGAGHEMGESLVSAIRRRRLERRVRRYRCRSASGKSRGRLTRVVVSRSPSPPMSPPLRGTVGWSTTPFRHSEVSMLCTRTLRWGQSRCRESATLADWDRLHHLILRGAFLAIKHVIPELRNRGGGAVVMTTAPIGAVGDPRLAAMSGGLRSLCRSAATGYGRDNTGSTRSAPGQWRRRLSGRRSPRSDPTLRRC